jgi:hypothetical protein
MQRQLEVDLRDTQNPTELSDAIANKIEKDLDGLKWKRRGVQLFAAALDRFLTNYATEVKSLAHVLKILRNRTRRQSWEKF